MSGGVDSSVAAIMLHEQGYEVIGLTMKTWDYASAGGSSKETGCCSLDSINDARSLAVGYGFPHYILDIRSEFGNYVIDNFVDEYLAGRTPNPCVLCNTHIKWDALLKRADKLDCEFIATGHYANIRQQDSGRYVVSKGKDENKDQSYVLLLNPRLGKWLWKWARPSSLAKAKATRYALCPIMTTARF
jgi:tRNA-specific 2-thiouridylase